MDHTYTRKAIRFTSGSVAVIIPADIVRTLKIAPRDRISFREVGSKIEISRDSSGDDFVME